MILCAVPRSIKGLYAAGNWKDVTALDSLWSELGYEHERIYFEEPPFTDLLDRCTRDVSDLVVHYSRWPTLIRAVRKAAPWIRVHVRAHNPEALQNWQRYQVRIRPTYRNVKYAYGVCRVLGADILCRIRADSILGISDWDNRCYWSRLPGRAKISWIPYHSPWPRLRKHVRPLPWAERQDTIVCMAGARDPIGKSSLENFRVLAQHLHGHAGCQPWEFLVSPGILHREGPSNLDGPLTALRELSEPWDLLCGCRAVAVLTPFGFGMKTTIVDALAAGCHVLIDPALARRLPEWLRCHCLQCDVRDRVATVALSERLAVPPASQDVNGRLRAEAMQALRVALQQDGA